MSLAELGRQAVARLRRAQHLVVTCHRNPDGDAIGSELALAELAEALGTRVSVINRDPTPPGLDQLPGAERIEIHETLPADFAERFDLVVTMECPGLDRPGFDGLDRLPILNLDHHRSNEHYGELNVVDVEAPAVGVMVWQLYPLAEVTPSAAAATNCFVALTTDTGDFRYSNTTPEAFNAAADMVARGARPEQVSIWIHESRRASSVRLLGEALRTLELHGNGQLAVLWVDAAAFRRAGAIPADTEGIINSARSIAGVRAAAFFKQMEPGVVRLSLRSKGDLDVCSVAASVGGGGHTNAAGGTLHMELDEARTLLVPRLVELLEHTP